MLRKRARTPPSPPPSPPPSSPSQPTLLRFETGNPATGVTHTGTLSIPPPPNFPSTTLVLDPVPGLMTPADICMFLRPFSDIISHFRPLRLLTERNTYIVVVQLRSLDDAENFATVFQGKPFLRGLVKETCRVRSVGDITFDTSPHPSPASATLFPSFRMFPDEGSELTACPVCLEPMDASNTALITTFCKHTMHADCLAKWDLNRCPVCRHSHELTPEASTCMSCDHREDLWMCVICAYVGCGVYKKKHAHQHFGETQHPFAMALEDTTFWTGEKLKAGSVWDYVSDRFVNRLLTSHDGKIVELTMGDGRGDSAGAASSSGGNDEVCCGSRSAEPVVIEDDEEQDRGLQAAVYASRMDAVVDEYRAKLERMEAEHAKEKEKLETDLRKAQAAAAQMSKEKKSLDRRLGDAEREVKSLRDKNGFLKSLNETLLRDKQGWRDEVDKLKKSLSDARGECAGLQDQLRDLMMHLEAQAKISAAVGGASGDSCRSDAAEMLGGDVRVGPSRRQRLATKTNRRTSHG
eukprot:GFKZ01004407.1.p1 GENE.GFKZ01004407.1~~GFKZ01004407.1.p1  ORF type:complete len:563 (-),score=70.05 GFKZ01004407.1:374-1939(-)